MASRVISSVIEKYIGKKNEILLFAYLNIICGYTICMEPKFLN